LSKIKEEPGKLYYPIANIKKDIFEVESDLIVSLIHHPFNWFQPEIKRLFQDHIENTSDIVLSGHEHFNSKSLHSDLNYNYTEYIEGAVLQSDNGKSGFNLIIVDLDQMMQKILFFEWKKDLYVNKDIIADWKELLHNKKIMRKKYQLSAEFKEILIDAGAAFTHPYLNHVTLNDIYIYPYLMNINVEEKKKTFVKKQYISASYLCKINESDNLILLSGAEKVGKTSLCKILYQEYHGKGNVPVFIEGMDIKTASFTDFENLVKENFSYQYNNTSLQYFNQEDNNKKVIIIDDFDKSKPNRKYKSVLLKNILNKYPNIILTGNEFFILEEYFNDESNVPNMLGSFEQYKILEFGNELRSELVKKWYGYGTNEFVEESELLIKHDSAINTINTIIGSNLVPSLPIFLLTILQTIETQATNLKASSYGFYYEYLIIKSFKNISIPNEEIDAFYNYITELANYLFENKLYKISNDQFKEFHKWYCKEYSINSEYTDLIKKLEDAKIIEHYGQNYRFKYRYIFYYFEARFIAQNITSVEIKERVSKLTLKLYKEEFANILMFLTHLSKDPFIISEILKSAKRNFSELEIVKFEDDIKSINDLLLEVPKLVLKKKDYNQVREERLKNLDELEKEIDEKEKVKEPFDEEDELEEIDVVTELNVAFKSIELLGQILKNYFGSLKGNYKFEIGSESYFVGLRALNSFYSILSENLDSIIEDITKIISEKEISDKDKKEDLSRKFLFGFFSILAFSFIKRISESVGTSNLTETFKDILSQYQYNSVRLIDISIKLDHSHIMPIDDIGNLKEVFSKNYLSSTLLKRLVIDHLYMFPVDFKVKQRICEILGISIDDQIYIEKTTTEHKLK